MQMTLLYIENPKNSPQKNSRTDKQIQQSNEYKINIQKLVTFLYTNNEISERECKKNNSF